eukprot:jgi/Mesvir1/8174/Mv12478-RA.1
MILSVPGFNDAMSAGKRTIDDYFAPASSAEPACKKPPIGATSLSTAGVIMVVMCGLQGSGKSTFANRLVTSDASLWARVCQDTISGTGKRGSLPQCIKAASHHLRSGRHVVVDRTHFNADQRGHFLKVARHVPGGPVAAHCVWLNPGVDVCKSRAQARLDHEGQLSPKMVPMVVGSTVKKFTPPLLAEGFASVVECVTDEDVARALIAVQEAAAAAAKRAAGAIGEPGTATTSLSRDVIVEVPVSSQDAGDVPA